MPNNLIYLTSSGAPLRGREALLAWVYDTVQYHQACIDTYVGKLNIVNLLQMRDPRLKISEILKDIFEKRPEIEETQVYFGDMHEYTLDCHVVLTLINDPDPLEADFVFNLDGEFD
jgi:hypothetical protein